MDYAVNRKEVIQFKRTIQPGDTVRLKERIKSPGTVESLLVRFYPGQELALHVDPYINHKGNKREHLVTYNGDSFLSGEDDTLLMPTIVSVDYDDEVWVDVTNTSASYAYTLNLHVVIDYYAGGSRVIGGVLHA